MSNMCPRPGRNPVRRKKNCLYIALSIVALYCFVQVMYAGEGFVPLRPLPDGESEARRLLKFITHYQYQCNTTLQVGNRSHWPICADKDVGIDVDSREEKIMYTIGIRDGFSVERSLAVNSSFKVFIVTTQKVPSYVHHINNTHVLKTAIVPNDYADFSRNSYGQRTINDLRMSLNHDMVDLLKLSSLDNNVNMWEVLHFMNQDDFVLNVHQLQIAMYVDKIDEDYLYNWYRALYELFYKEGFRLYHTASSDSLCLQVTMMESCIYYMSWVRNPGPKVFVLHPPADYGTSDLEEQRLLDHITSVQVECKQQIIGGPNDPNLQFTTPGQPQWPVCSNGFYELFSKPCSVIRFRAGNDYSLEQKLIKEGCSIHTFEPILKNSQAIYRYKIHSHYPTNRKDGPVAMRKSVDEVFHLIKNLGAINLLEIDLPGREWEILTHVLDSGVLENVTQVVAEIQIPDFKLGRHPTVLRSHYSELMRLEFQGFSIFHSSPSTRWKLERQTLQHFGDDCCFKLGFIKKKIYS